MAKRGAKIRPYTMTKAALLPVAALMLLGIVLARLTEDRTAGMALVPVLVYLVYYCVFMIACRKRVFRFVRMAFTDSASNLTAQNGLTSNMRWLA